jgi:hypothetical protein
VNRPRRTRRLLYRLSLLQHMVRVQDWSREWWDRRERWDDRRERRLAKGQLSLFSSVA